MSRKPRVLLDILAYGPRDGGFSTLINDLLSACQNIEEIEFIILCHQRNRGYFSSFPFETITVNFPYKMRFFASLLLLPCYCRLASVDAVHCEISALPFGIGVPGSVTVCDLDFLDNSTASPHTFKGAVMLFYWRHIYLRSLRYARITKAISKATAANMKRSVKDTRPAKIVYPFVRIPKKIIYQRNWPADSQPVRLLFLGSVVPRKNLSFLLQALPQFRRPWRLDVVGNLWWGQNGIDWMAVDQRVTFHGYVPDEEREQFLAECHILIAPSRCEGFGYPVAEAMANSMLVLTSDIDVFREYVPAPLRFSLADPTHLADCFNKLNKKSYERLCQLCRKSIERFSFSANVASHRDFFHQLIEYPFVGGGTADE